MDWWFAGTILAQTLDVLRWAWPLGTALAGAAVVSTVAGIVRQRKGPPLRLAWHVLLVLNPLAMAAAAGAWGCRGCASGSNVAWAIRASLLLLTAQFALAGWTVWRAGPWRPSVAALHALLIWPSCCAALVIGTMLR